MINEKKISFIICVNHERNYEECLFYLDRLQVPEDFEVDVFAIRDAASIFSAYEQAMEQSDAKYKIYMHQDVFLINENLLVELVTLFEENPRIGMIGLLGARNLPENRRFYQAWDAGNVIGCSDKKVFQNELDKNAARVCAIDGMFMMTQYDVPWREDVLDGWDFYDFSQSMEFLHRGYEIWVPGQEKPWSIHDCGCLSLEQYDERQEKFLSVYRDDFPDYSGEKEIYKPEYRAHLSVMMELKEEMKKLLFMGKEKEIKQSLEKVWDERFCDTELVILKNILEVLQEEETAGESEEKRFLAGVKDFSEAHEKYLNVKYGLWRERYAAISFEEGKGMQVSGAAVRVIKRHCLL